MMDDPPHLSEKETDPMRLDKYLKVSRLIKRRTVANEACDGGRVTVNGKVARASYDVKVGDVIALHFGERVLAVEVLNVSETAGKSEASLLYREVNAQ
jgi:ribosomal 50S subunit-recycling heat shock protein